MSNDQVTRPRTRKTCEVPPAFVLLKEREEGERRTERRAEHTANKDWDPLDTSCLRPEHTLSERTCCFLWQPDNHAKPTCTLTRIILHPASSALSLVSTTQPVAVRHISTP